MKQCSMCGEVKDETEFSYKSVEKGTRQGHCKTCQKQVNSTYYAANTVKHKARVRETNIERKRDSRAYVQDYLSTHPCVDCGETDIVVLDFDHVRGSKVLEVTTMANTGYSLDNIKAEIDKCEIRCANCHRRRHYRER